MINWNENDDDLDLSIQKFESMLKTDEVYFFDSQEFEEIIYHYLGKGRQTLAKKALRIALEQHPDSVELKLAQVEIYIYDNELENAERIITDLLDQDPNNDEAYILKSQIFSKKRLNEKAIECLQKALECTDDKEGIYSMIAMEYLLINNFEQAKNYFIKSLEEDLSEYKFTELYNAIYCFDMLNQHKEAISYLLSYIDKNPYNQIAWHQLGRQYNYTKQYQDALKAFDYAILIDEQFVGALIEKGKTQEKLNLYKEAIQTYKESLEIGDPTIFALIRLGKCYEKTGQRKLALESYLAAAEEDPSSTKAWIALSDLHYRLSDFNKSLYYLKKALDLDSYNGNYWKRYANINRALELHEETVLGCEKALANGYENLSVYLQRIEALIFLGRYDDALTILEFASVYYKNRYEVGLRLAGVQYLLKNKAEGRATLEKALKNNGLTRIGLFKKLFPQVFNLQEVQDIINNFRP